MGTDGMQLAIGSDRGNRWALESESRAERRQHDKARVSGPVGSDRYAIEQCQEQKKGTARREILTKREIGEGREEGSVGWVEREGEGRERIESNGKKAGKPHPRPFWPLIGWIRLLASRRTAHTALTRLGPWGSSPRSTRWAVSLGQKTPSTVGKLGGICPLDGIFHRIECVVGAIGVRDVRSISRSDDDDRQRHACYVAPMLPAFYQTKDPVLLSLLQSSS
ncbi:hypothetical protein VTO42DRAFT_6351 [Malbranchea cinnamomea]